MKTIYSLFLILFAWNQSLHSQSKEWQFINPWQYQTISSVKYSNDQLYFFDELQQEMVIVLPNGEYESHDIGITGVREFLWLDNGDYLVLIGNDQFYKSSNEGESYEFYAQFNNYAHSIRWVKNTLVIYNPQSDPYKFVNGNFEEIEMDDNRAYVRFNSELLLYKVNGSPDTYYYSYDLGETWKTWESSHFNLFTSSHTNKILAINYLDEIFEFKDGELEYLTKPEHPWLPNYPSFYFTAVSFNHNLDTIVLGHENEGLYYSYNGGENWNSLLGNYQMNYNSSPFNCNFDKYGNILFQDNYGLAKKTIDSSYLEYNSNYYFYILDNVYEFDGEYVLTARQSYLRNYDIYKSTDLINWDRVFISDSIYNLNTTEYGKIHPRKYHVFHKDSIIYYHPGYYDSTLYVVDFMESEFIKYQYDVPKDINSIYRTNGGEIFLASDHVGMFYAPSFDEPFEQLDTVNISDYFEGFEFQGKVWIVRLNIDKSMTEVVQYENGKEVFKLLVDSISPNIKIYMSEEGDLYVCNESGVRIVDLESGIIEHVCTFNEDDKLRIQAFYSEDLCVYEYYGNNEMYVGNICADNLELMVHDDVPYAHRSKGIKLLTEDTLAIGNRGPKQLLYYGKKLNLDSILNNTDHVLPEQNKTSKITIVPNPVYDRFTIIEAKLGDNIHMYNTTGVQVRNQSFSGPISVETLPSGLYFLTLMREGKRVGVGKVIVSR